jgi:16S rRNA (adenine1518-N6/adenine1519-N6)-dimethyltransferase
MPQRYDQHFLRDENIARAIAEAACPQPDEVLLEIGPGPGILSKYLVQRPNPLIGIEIDPQYHQKLVETYPQATWILGDALQVSWPEVPLYLVSNLPYSITGPFLMRVFEHRAWIRGGVLMLQKEVAQRLYAQPGERQFGRLSALFQVVYQVERLRTVRPGSFSPPPKVLSEVIRFTRLPQIPLKDWPSFATIVRAAFRQPRQTLSRNLRSAGFSCPPHLATRRPHEIPLPELIALWRWLSDPIRS